MQKLTRVVSVLVACAAVVVAVSIPSGEARSSETLACSSTTTSKANLTGTWSGSDGAIYRIRQTGTCVWAAGVTRGSATVAFFGSVSSTGSSVYGLWANLSSAPANGTILLSARSSTLLVTRAATGNFKLTLTKKGGL